MDRIGMMIEQIRWDIKRGAVDKVSNDYILDRAEEILPEEEFDEFCDNKEYLAVYQAA